jgi:hypothetical protein
MEYGIGGECSKHGGDENALKNVVRETKGKRTEYNIKMDVIEIRCEVWIGFS